MTKNRNIVISGIALAVVALVQASAGMAQDARKDATSATKAANQKLLGELPFSDRSDFDDAHRGFVAPLPDAIIKGTSGNPIWNPQQYAFIKEGSAAPGTVNPSLWRQAQLINISGLFQ